MRAAALKTGSFPALQRGVRGVSPPQGGCGASPHKTSKETTGSSSHKNLKGSHRSKEATGQRKPQEVAPIKTSKEITKQKKSQNLEGCGGQPPTKPRGKRKGKGAGAIPNKPPNPPYQGGYVELGGLCGVP